MFDVLDKVVLVTGGVKGIGAGSVRAFLEEGAKHVAALDIDIENGELLEKELAEKYGENKVKFHKCDVTTCELDEIYDTVISEFGYIDVVVNSAGIANDSPEMFLKMIEINLSATIKSSFKAFELMRIDRGGKGGTIINISSITCLYKARMVPVYGATKSAVLHFSNVLGIDPHHSRSNVRVLTICFGCTDTTLFTPSNMGCFDKETEELMVKALQILPFQKVESAIIGLIHAYKHGESGSTWLVTTDKPAEDITDNIAKAYQIKSLGVFT